MNKTIPSIFLLVLSFSCSEDSKRQDQVGGLNNAKVSEQEYTLPYSTFSKGYQARNAEMISSVYAEDALLINVYDGAAPQSFKGLANIRNFFASSLKQAKKDSTGLKITFKITDRQAVDQLILDNGYYKLTILSSDQIPKERYGKFSIALAREPDGWKFSVDTNASATESEYEQALAIEERGRKIGSGPKDFSPLSARQN